jgi:hypothetical protein
MCKIAIFGENAAKLDFLSKMRRSVFLRILNKMIFEQVIVKVKNCML